jgi:hypothetical protein
MTTERLYNLLPTIYRQRDLDEGEPLRALLAIMEQELQAVEEDIAALYENWFIETCDEWVIPYIGDLLGIRGLSRETSRVASQRAHVANAIGYRRRKGTAAILERVAEDITGWKARAVEYFNLLGATQHLYHLRPTEGRTCDLRDRQALAQMNTPFQKLSTLVDVRRIARHQEMARQHGRANIPNVGLFLWRWSSYPITRSAARRLKPGCYTFNPLGYNMPLFVRPQPKTDLTQRTQAIHVPALLTRQVLANELARRRAGAKSDYFGPQPALEIFINGVKQEDFVTRDLSDWPAVESVTVDPELGRLALPGEDGEQPAEVQVSYAYGFSADLGGGPYDRRPTLTIAASGCWQAIVSKSGLASADNSFTDLATALAAWSASKFSDGLIQITDNSAYDISGIPLELPEQARLTIEAADSARPCLIGPLTVSGSGRAQLTLNGLLLDEGIALGFRGNLRLQVSHCTLAPSGIWSQTPAPEVQITIDHSLVSALRLPAEMAGLIVRDSIIGPASWTNQRPVLVSGNFNLSAESGLTTDSPELNLTIGAAGPYRVALAKKPATPAEARDELQAAIRAAHPGQALAEAQVILTHSPRRLIVLAGVPEVVTIEPTEDDPYTASELALDPAHARPALAAVGERLAPFPGLRSAAPAINVTIQARQGREGPYQALLAGTPASLTQARDQLQAALRQADDQPAFAEALVAIFEERLLIVPGASELAMRFGPTPDDPATARELGLLDPAAIAAPDRPQAAGPPTTMERVTVFGPVWLKELVMASDVIFTEPALVQRRQVGNIRFSYVPPASQTPQRYRCQPDFALTAAAEAAGRPLSDEERHTVLLRVQPRFTARQYGQPGFGQLSPQCAAEIAAGAENGAEMGAFQSLLQPQREANLRASLEEYLRAGLEAGIFFVN